MRRFGTEFLSLLRVCDMHQLLHKKKTQQVTHLTYTTCQRRDQQLIHKDEYIFHYARVPRDPSPELSPAITCHRRKDHHPAEEETLRLLSRDDPRTSPHTPLGLGTLEHGSLGRVQWMEWIGRDGGMGKRDVPLVTAPSLTWTSHHSPLTLSTS